MSNMTKWGLDQKQITTLTTIENDIAAEQNAIANGFIRMGQHFSRAKALFDDPAVFNKWASERTNFAPRTIQALVQIADKFGGDETLKKLPKGTLQELLRAPEALLEEVREEVEQTGSTDGAKKMRERVKESKIVNPICEGHARGEIPEDSVEDEEAMAELRAMRESSMSVKIENKHGKAQVMITIGSDDTYFHSIEFGVDTESDLCSNVCDAISSWLERQPIEE